jgi:uncharacterized protein
VAAGTAAGDALPPLPTLADAETSAGAATSAAATRVTAIEDAIKDVRTALTDLETTLTDLQQANAGNRINRATAVVAAVDILNTNLTASAAADSVDEIHDAARAARVGARAAAANGRATLQARFPGSAGNLTITVRARRGESVLSIGSSGPQLRQVQAGDLVYVSGGTNTGLFIAQQQSGAWNLTNGTTTIPLSNLTGANIAVAIVTFSISALMPGRFAQEQTWENLAVDRTRLQDGLLNVFGEEISNRTRMLETPLVIIAPNETTAVQLAEGLLGIEGLANLIGEKAEAQTTFRLTGGNDGVRPGSQSYEGSEDINTQEKSGLLSFQDIEEISIVAAPGVTFNAMTGSFAGQSEAAIQAVINHCEFLRYRVAVLDTPNNISLGQARQYRAQLETSRAALYYPWVEVQDPIRREPIHVPPSGFIAGIYARNDVEKGVHKAPANERVRGTTGLEVLINKAQQDILNPLGINCIRYFENSGDRVWGARTLSADPEWKYLNIRRYFVYLEYSIDRSSAWAVFEPNGPRLWNNVRNMVSDFLFNEWKSGHLAGTRPEEAYFVRCDLSTMSQNDLDNGRMICEIGVAPLYPAEFVIFRIGQWTNRRS